MALADDGVTERRNLQLLCPYCNRVKGTRGGHGYRLKMAELRADNARTGVMVDDKLAVITGKRLAKHHRGGWVLTKCTTPNTGKPVESG